MAQELTPARIESCIEAEKVQARICKLVNDTITDKYEKATSKFEAVVDNVLQQVTDKLTNKMSAVMMTHVKTTLDDFSKRVTNTEAVDDLMDNIIFELGLKFTQAFDNKDDRYNFESYQKFVLQMKEEAKKKEDEEATTKSEAKAETTASEGGTRKNKRKSKNKILRGKRKHQKSSKRVTKM